METTDARAALEGQLERHRSELLGYCYRMLASPFDAEDAVQETMLRAWRALDRFEQRAAMRTWLYRIATNVCMDMLARRERRQLPMDLGPAREPLPEHLNTPEVPWVEPLPDAHVNITSDDPETAAISRETVRLAFVSALQKLPARQRAVLLLRDVLQWSAAEVAALLDTTEPSVNSAMQRARSALESSRTALDRMSVPRRPTHGGLLERYVAAFERYDMGELAELIREDALQSMPPYDLWLEGRDDVLAFWAGPGAACRGSRVIPVGDSNGSPAFGQYKPAADGDGYEPWALQVLEIVGDRVGAFTFFLETERLFPLFGLSMRLRADGSPARR